VHVCGTNSLDSAQRLRWLPPTRVLDSRCHHGYVDKRPRFELPSAREFLAVYLLAIGVPILLIILTFMIPWLLPITIVALLLLARELARWVAGRMRRG
jgi:hypothetical protein